MKKLNKYIYLLTCFAFFLTGCKSTVKENSNVLSVTIEPQKYFLEKIVGDKYEINCIVSGNANPESFDIAPSQIAAISKSKAYFEIGFLGIENLWIKNLKKANPNILFVNCSEGITPLGNHEHCDHDGHEHHHHGHAGADPHIWSSPATAKIMADNMYQAMLKMDEKNREFYTENYKKLIEDINKTDNIIKSYIEKAPSKSFIMYHPSLSYFAKEYGLNQYTIERDGKNPSPVQLKELIDTSKAEGVKVVFIQMEYDQKNAETITEAIGGKAVPINLMSYDWDNEMIKVAQSLAE